MRDIPGTLKNFHGTAVVMYFDDKSAGKIEAVWQKVNSIYPRLGIKPHITLCSFEKADLDALKAAVIEFCDTVRSFSLKFGSVGSFWDKNENVIFYAPVVTKELLEHHRLFNKILEKTGLRQIDYFLPDRWVPHCTIDMKVGPEEFAGKFEIARDERPVYEVRIETLEIIKFMPPEPLFTGSLK